MSKFFQVQSYFRYWLDAVDEHSLHSPFFYDLYTRVIKPARNAPTHRPPAESLRQQLLKDKREIVVQDLGRGSLPLQHANRRIHQIARTSLSPARYARLYQKLIQAQNANVIVELGTSLGVNTIYLSNDNAATQVYTFEGAPTLAAAARTVFDQAGARNITLIEGNIDQTLPAFLAHQKKIDLILLDANHRYTPTLTYFKWLLPYMHTNSVMIFDDIYLTPEMKQAWQEIRMHPLVYGSVDLFRCGLVFFDPGLNKQHVILQF